MMYDSSCTVKKQLNKNGCSGCPSICCKYVCVEIDKPEDKEDFHNIRWYLMHENVQLWIDHEGAWMLEFKTPCKNLDKEDFCRIHKGYPKNKGKSPEKYKEPKVCKDMSSKECEFCNLDPAHKHMFTDHKQFEKYIENNMPEVITQEETEDIPVIILNDKKIDELIKKLKTLKKNKEFEINDVDGDGFSIEYKN